MPRQMPEEDSKVPYFERNPYEDQHLMSVATNKKRGEIPVFDSIESKAFFAGLNGINSNHTARV